MSPSGLEEVVELVESPAEAVEVERKDPALPTEANCEELFLSFALFDEGGDAGVFDCFLLATTPEIFDMHAPPILTTLVCLKEVSRLCSSHQIRIFFRQ